MELKGICLLYVFTFCISVEIWWFTINYCVLVVGFLEICINLFVHFN